MRKPTFQLMYESSFLGEVLASAFADRFSTEPAYKGALVLGDTCVGETTRRRMVLHARLAGRPPLNDQVLADVRDHYPDFSEMSLEVIRLRGFPSDSSATHREYFRSALTGSESTRLERDLLSCGSSHYVFTFVNRIFRGAWLEPPITLLNAHPGVLPFARGVGALEQIAATGNAEWFTEAVGATVHYIGNAIDAGPIVRCQRVANPFAFGSLSALRAFIFLLAFDMMGDIASGLISHPCVVPVGILSTQRTEYPCFRSADRTIELREKAAATFLRMKATQP